MSPKKLFPHATNSNRAKAGSEKGKAGRLYPITVAKRLNNDLAFRQKVCKAILKKTKDFDRAIAGADIPTRIYNVSESGKAVTPKTNLRILWKDGSTTNFRTTISDSSQIDLHITDNFINEFSAQFNVAIPTKVQEALRLFSGSHLKQKEILSSISIDYVGAKVRREVEENYFNRLTLASMYGYDDEMPVQLLEWFRQNCDKVFLFCFAIGAAKNRSEMVDFMWYKSDGVGNDGFEIFDLRRFAKVIYFAMRVKGRRASMVRPNDALQIGSTIAFPFGNLQQHENKLQFRHSLKKMRELALLKCEVKNNFGSAPKVSGHKNEEMIAEALNKNIAFRTHFCERIGMNVSDFVAATAGGRHAPQVESIIGGKTAEKTDVRVMWQGGALTNISLKKDAAGQVYLVTVRNFVAVYEAQYNVTVPDKVRRALALFIGEAEDSKAILDATDLSVDGEKVRSIAYEQNHRLVFEVIRNYDANMATMLLDWLKKQIASVCELCFSAGAVKDRDKWANVIWYKNLVDADGQGLDFLVPINRIVSALIEKGDENVVERGPKNAGSTIQLPFGHLQYHLRQLEFYQQLKKIQSLLASVST
jgi:hypothetical protein